LCTRFFLIHTEPYVASFPVQICHNAQCDDDDNNEEEEEEYNDDEEKEEEEK
jgi:hypothetical protein